MMFLPTSLTTTGLATLGAPGAAVPLPQEDLQEKPDRTWVRLTGDVSVPAAERFTLDYGEGKIVVEMDDWDWYDETNHLRDGERVTVYGRIDDGFYELRTIEADSVYVHDRSTFYYASDVDEEGDAFFYPHYVHGFLAHPDGSWMTVTGTVEEIDGHEFTVHNGLREVQVDTDEMAYDPLDDEGFQRIDVGDEVAVTGHIDVDFFEKDEIKAQTIVSMSRDATKKGKRGASKEAQDAESKQKEEQQQTES